MSELRDILKEEYIKKEEDSFTPQVLMEMIEEVMDVLGPGLIQEGGDSPDVGKSVPFPMVKITELWGKTTKSGRNKNADRKYIERLTAQLPGDTVEEKLKEITKVTTYNPRIGVPRILSTLIFLELMRSIVVEYTEAVSGFLFEGFLAGLFGGKSIQVTDVKGEEAEGQVGKPITDVELRGRHYSLKLLSPGTIIEGSFKNLVNHFRALDEVVYLVLRKKENDVLEWHEFEITLPTFVHWIGHAKKIADVAVTKQIEITGAEMKKVMVNKKLLNIDGTDYPVSKIQDGAGNPVKKGSWGTQGVENPEQIYVATYETGETEEAITLSAAGKDIWGKGPQGIVNYKKARDLSQGGNKDALVAHLETAPGYIGKAAKFQIPRGYVDKAIAGASPGGGTTARNIGTLNLSEDALRAVAEQYAAKLNEDLIPMYTALQEFTENINAYFLTGKRSKDRLGHAMAASEDATEIHTRSNALAAETKEEETAQWTGQHE